MCHKHKLAWASNQKHHVKSNVFRFLKKVFKFHVHHESRQTDLKQRCPRVFFRSPQMWRMNMAIRHILKIALTSIPAVPCLTQLSIHERIKRYILGLLISSYALSYTIKHSWTYLKVLPGPTHISQYLLRHEVLIEKCELKLKTLIFVQNIAILKYLEIEPFATFKQPFATCGKWRMGWTTLD